MNVTTLTQEEKARFHQAVRTFRGEGPVSVTPQKLAVYLEQTQEIEAPPAQRLRWLSIALEHDRFESGYDGLRSIYQAAAQADPADFRILHSWGLSASYWAASLHSEAVPSAEKKTIADEAESVLRSALELSPQDSRIAHTLGLVFYEHPSWANDPDGYRARAVEWFTRAVAWDPDNVVAQLYVAHCFHDRLDWPRAIAEYEKVDLQQLARRWPVWRAVKCREQLAHCHACAGHREEAIRQFTAFLDDIGTWDDGKVEKDIINIHELVDAVAHKLDHPELLRRTRELVKRFAGMPRMRWLEKCYQELREVK